VAALRNGGPEPSTPDPAVGKTLLLKYVLERGPMKSDLAADRSYCRQESFAGDWCHGVLAVLGSLVDERCEQ